MSQAILYLDFLHEIALDGATLDISSGEQAALDSQYRDFRTRLKALWAARLANQMAVLPPFDQVFREFRRALRHSDLP